MKWVIAALCFFFLAASPAQANCTAPCTKAQITTDINTNWPDNTSQLITPALLRSTVLDLVNSYLDVNGASTFTCPTHQFLTSIATLSTYACAQPAFTDISGSITASQMNSGTNASAATFWRGDGTWSSTLTNTSTALTLQNGTSGQDVKTTSLGTIGTGLTDQFAPHTAQTTWAQVNTAGPISLCGVDATTNPSNSFSPCIYLDTLTGGGVTPIGLPGGAQAYGVTITGTGQPTQGTGNVAQMNFVNVSPGPYAANSDSGAIVSNWWCWKGGDCGLQFWSGGGNAAGTFASPPAVVNTDPLFQISGLGRHTSPSADWDGNPGVRIDGRSTETHTATAWGGMLAIDTTTKATTNEFMRLGVAENIMIGNDNKQWVKGDNTFNGALGTLLIKDGTMPSPLLSGINAAVMGSVNSGMQISGTTTNDNACAGCYGEYTSSIVLSGSSVSLASGTPKDITTLSLTAGDWDVSAVCATNPNGATTTSIAFCSINTAANTLGAFPADGTTQVFTQTALTAGNAESLTTEPIRVSINATTTYHLVMSVTFAVNTMSGYGKIRARRVR